MSKSCECVAYLFIVLSCQASPPALAAPNPTLLEAEKWVHSRRSVIPHNLAPGITAVLVEGNDVHMFADGMQRLHGPAADKDTLMEVGSVSKTLVGLGLATLVTRRDLTWSDPVRRWLGSGFALGPHSYVSESLTLKDLMAHRTGLAEGQGEFSQSWLPMPEFVHSLKHVEPINTLRDTFAYSNTGWSIAGEVLRAATNSSSWCEGLRRTLLEPLNLTRTFCHRNEVPAGIAAKSLAAVHKMSPCSGVGKVATYEFVATGAPTAFAWGAADAAGSVISSVADMSRIMQLLLGKTSSSIIAPEVVQEMLTGQMITPLEWQLSSGIPGWSKRAQTAGHAGSAGLGFDYVGDISLVGKRFAYAEKSGDTEMHKARLGLLPDIGVGVLLLSNLGGSVGGPLTAMKFGVLTKLVGGTDHDANLVTDAALNTTGFWEKQWAPMTTCTACGTVASSRQCSPSGLDAPPLPLSSFAGTYGTPAYGMQALRLEASSSSKMQATIGAVRSSVLRFSNTSMVMEAPCNRVATTLASQSVPWADRATSKLAHLPGNCTLVEWVIPPEIQSAGVSAQNGTVAFPYGCGIVPLPDGPSLYVVSHAGKGVLASFLGEALPATSAAEPSDGYVV